MPIPKNVTNTNFNQHKGELEPKKKKTGDSNK